jgi:hypothetical protein
VGFEWDEAMNKFSNEEFFAAILVSNILTPYLEQNPELADLMKSPDHPNIHYYENYTLAKEILPALKQRLAHMTARKIDHNLKATQQLVSFLEEYPESEIHNVTFNCPTQHYGVRCGQVDDDIHVICVMTGGHIPDEILGVSQT